MARKTTTAPSDLDQNTIQQTIQDISGEYGKEDQNFTNQLARYASSIQAGYDAQRKASDRQYAENRAAADRAALGRGMGRSSYNLQNMANIANKGAEANQEIWRNQQADLNKFAYQLNQDMQDQANWQAQMDYQKDRDRIADEQWQKQFDEGIRQFNAQLALQNGGRGGGGGGGYSRSYSNNNGSDNPGENAADSIVNKIYDWNSANRMAKNISNLGRALNSPSRKVHK